MKLIIKVMLIAGLAYLSGLYLPWWGMVVVAAGVSLAIPTSSFGAFVSGFIGVGLLWMVISWKIDIESHSILTAKVAALFKVDDPIYLVIGSGFIGAIAGGLGSLWGNSFRQIFIKKKKASFYS
ncbi:MULTISPECIES: hypothetical protein [unclassified Imperialibacter]|uniref:hypothetical protein n=1 Tax=unclassified Imperialibacter TaxID=2629706 RepID=UPI001254CF5E|nr:MULTISPECIES: hypothetical protein [unclassified Imperialibacter]CAD5268063.1 conserved membrane hypothetical protein [Imperialibacter sp. 75]CAD5280607.1 conserved membrane hypothetical protein [Imperialibacter sp. 89]VVT01506.1 conserved membrane hypothetical protein [Imperialibacter sp. EC-SDR9]